MTPLPMPVVPAHAVADHREHSWDCPCLPARLACEDPECGCAVIVHGYDRVARVRRAEGGHP